jgi:hypothetical protein
MVPMGRIGGWLGVGGRVDGVEGEKISARSGRWVMSVLAMR